LRGGTHLLNRLAHPLTDARARQDTQIAADVITNTAFFEALRRCGEVSSAASEEESAPQTLNPAGAYSVRSHGCAGALCVL
jgi:fructose-1,6-bisphosphatase